LPVVCVETQHMQALLKAQIKKTDRSDARGIAQMMRVGLYRPVHVKTLRSQKLRMLLTHRKLLQSKAIAIENDLKWPDQPATTVRAAPCAGGRPHLAAVLQEGRKYANIHVRSGVIWGIPVKVCYFLQIREKIAELSARRC
jgi:transposase